MTAQDSKRDQDQILLAAYKRFRWLVDNRAGIKQGTPEFRNRPDYYRLHSEVAYACQDGLVTAHSGKLLGCQPMTPRDQMRCQRAKKKLATAGLIELHADDGGRQVTHLSFTETGAKRAEILLAEANENG